MAINNLHEYTIMDKTALEQGMNATANAIREKTGGTDTLVWDEATGFADAVSAISAGGGGGGDELFRMLVARDYNLPAINDESITEVGPYGLYGYPATSINLPNLQVVGTHAFDNACFIEAIFPNLGIINPQAFKDCQNLTVFDAGMNGVMLQAEEFANCFNLKTVVWRNTPMMIMSNPFEGCSHLTGEIDPIFNPEGLQDGYIYVPAASVETLKSNAALASVASQIRALEDYTVDGTTTGALDPAKVAGN